MQRKLTPTEIETYTPQALAIYREEKLPEHSFEKFIETDIEDMNSMLEWITKLEKDPSIKQTIESTNYFTEAAQKEKQMLKSLGCSDEQMSSVAFRLADINICKFILNHYIEALQKRQFKPNLSFADISALEDFNHATNISSLSIKNTVKKFTTDTQHLQTEITDHNNEVSTLSHHQKRHLFFKDTDHKSVPANETTAERVLKL